MPMTAPIDAADVLEHVLRLSDAVEALVVEFGEHLPPEIEPVRAELSELERELEDVLDNREAEEALADANVHGTISWSEFEAQLDRG